MTIHTPRIRQTANCADPFEVARAVQKPAALTYPDYLSMGREWAREQITAAAMSRGRLPSFTASQIEDHARKFADVNCPVETRKAYFAAKQAERDAEFGASGFRVGQYGLERVS